MSADPYGSVNSIILHFGRVMRCFCLLTEVKSVKGVYLPCNRRILKTMISYYVSKNGVLENSDNLSEGCWISVVDPSPDEISTLIDDYGLDSGFVKSSLDEEESSRIEREDDQTLIIVDAPVSSVDDDKSQIFFTTPIGIILTEDYVFTISLKPVRIIDEAEGGVIRNLRPNLKTRFVLQLLLRIATQFLIYLKQVDKDLIRS